MPLLNESIVKDAALAWFGELGNAIDYGPQIVILHDALLPKLLSVEWCVDVSAEETEAIA